MESFKIGLQGFCKKQCWGFELGPDSPVWYLNGISKETAQSTPWIQREIFTIRDLAELDHQIFNEVHGLTKHKAVQKRASEFMNTYKSFTQQQKTLESPIPSRGELARKRLFCGYTMDVVGSSFELKHHTDSGDTEELETSRSTPIQNLSDNESLDSSTDLSGPRWDAEDDILTTSTPNKKTTPTPSNLNNYPRTPTSDFLKDVHDTNEINFMREFSSYENQGKSWLTTSKKRSQEVPQLEVDPLIFGGSARTPDGYRTPKGCTRRCPQRRLTKQLAALSLASENTSTPPGSPMPSKISPRSFPPSEPSTPTKTSTTPVAPCRSLGSKQRLSSCRSESIDDITDCASTKKTRVVEKKLYRIASIS